MTAVGAATNASFVPSGAPKDALVRHPEPTWTEVCPVSRIPAYYGVAALLPGDVQAAVFRLPGDEILAIGNIDPISGAAVLSRGIVGDADGVPVVASPIYKERFDLRTGQCLDAEESVPTFPVRVVDDVIFVGPPPTPPPPSHRGAARRSVVST